WPRPGPGTPAAGAGAAGEGRPPARRCCRGRQGGQGPEAVCAGDQKTAIFDLQGQLSREQTLSTFITPGEFMKMAKRELAPLNVHENCDLKLKISGLETEVQVARRRGDAAWKHLPASIREAAQKELIEPPPSPSLPGHAGA
ncbi:unnamed protein product, partial [Prorocentrum cordatum]